MVRHCAAYGCSNSSTKQSCKERKVSFHRFPLKDDELLKRWLLQIQRKDFLPNRHSVLCSEHFNADDFSNQMFSSRRELNKGAVPSIFAHKPAIGRRKTSKQFGASSIITDVTDLEPATWNVSCFLPDDQPFGKETTMISIKDKILPSMDRMCKLNFEQECYETDYISNLPDQSIDLIPRNHSLKAPYIMKIFPNESDHLHVQTNDKKAHMCFSDKKLHKLDTEGRDESDSPQQSDDFFKLSAEAENVSMPNSRWSVACVEDCIIYAKWNSEYTCERRVVICRDLSTKVFLMNVEVLLSIEGCTNENLPQLLQKVNDFIICKNADSRISDCLGFVEDKMQELCCVCSQSALVEKVINQESNHQKSLIKKFFLDAISHLSTEQQTAITSCPDFKTCFS